MRFSVYSGLNSSFQIGCPAFVQPEVLPTSIANQIPTPGMTQFVRNNINVLPISRDDGWCCECEYWILHATVREARRQDKNIILCPLIRVDQLLGNLDEFLCISL